ncbi:SRPBCC family protein [Demetria terragena]|uniref:SRPBCC family protein n=1 Tax=Demetria terragena TaxID=63959 RepID=UPI0003A95273|nr:SRPBCC family protein [Demetria terragena]
MAHLFRFAGEYPVAAPRDRVVAALRDADHWPQWWPQIRSVERIDAERGLVTIRSLLPMTLRLTLIAQVDDVEAGTFRAGLDGDLVGWIETRVSASGSALSQVAYEQECHVAKRGVGPIAAAVRPILTLNHTAMMRSGMRGLGTYAQ